MKKTATLIALAGLSMAAKTEHSFLGKKPVEFPAEIDPKMVIKPAHDIDPGMMRKPHKNVDKGIFVKPKKPQVTIAADDNDDELLLIYRPDDNIDPGMVRRPPFGSEIDPKFVIKPPRGFDDGIYVRPRPRTEPVWVDDEMRVVSGTEVDPGMVIKPKRGDIDPGFVRKPAKGWEIDPKIFVKPKRGDVLYADDDEMMVRRPPSENIKYDAENDDELAVMKEKANHVREPRLIGDFPTKPWPGQPIYADDADDELMRRFVSDPIIPKEKSHDDELMYQRFPTAVSDLGIPPRPMGMGHMHARDDEFAVLGEKLKQHVREPRLIGDFYTKPWPGQPVYADAEDDELALTLTPIHVSDPIIPRHDDELAQMTEFVREPRIIGDHGKSADDELVYAFSRIDSGMVRRPPQENTDQGIWKRPMGNVRYFDAENDELVYVGGSGMISVSDPIIHGGHTHDDESSQMTDFVREPRIVGDHGKSADDADDEFVYASSRIDPGMVRRPPFTTIDQGMIRRPRNDIKYLDAENDDELGVIGHVREPRLIGDFPTKPWPGQPVYADAEDNELIMFADQSLDRPRRGIIDLKELTKPWYQQQQTMYADDADNELLWARMPAEKKDKGGKPHKVNDLKTGKPAQMKKPEKKTEGKEQEKAQSHKIKQADDAADDELILFADKSLDARLERRKIPIDLKELTKPWYQQQTMYADDSLIALGELLEDN